MVLRLAAHANVPDNRKAHNRKTHNRKAHNRRAYNVRLSTPVLSFRSHP